MATGAAPGPYDDEGPGDLERELATVLNRHSAENGSGTPDYVLARYLIGCLENFDAAIGARARWRAEDVQIPALRVHP